MKIILTRHGETDWNNRKIIQGSTDTMLNETGLMQAASLAETLTGSAYHIQHIYTSRLKRAYDTADIVSQRLSLPCTIIDGLEEMNLGLWEGMSWKEAAQRYPEHYSLWHEKRRYTRPPEGESYQDVLERFHGALKRVCAMGLQEVLVVTHSANIMTLLSYLNKTPFHEMVVRYKPQNTSLITLESSLLPDSVTDR